MNTWKSSAGVNTGKSGYKKAFTLAELLTAVLVISVIMVALAPVITKRMKDNVSVTTDNKKGLEIFTNPGTYTFDVPIGINTLFLQGSGGGGGGAGSTETDIKTINYTSNSSWSVPVGVNKVTLKIIGAGGGGGSANGKANSSVMQTQNTTTTLYNNKCLNDEFLAIRGAASGADLCITKMDLSFDDVGPNPNGEIKENTEIPANHTGIADYESQSCVAATNDCCWEGVSKQWTGCAEATSGARTGCNRPVCNKGAAAQICNFYKLPVRGDWSKEYGYYRLMQKEELENIKKFAMEWGYKKGADGLNLCSHDDPNVAGGTMKASAIGAARCSSISTQCFDASGNAYCYTNMILGDTSALWSQAVDYLVNVDYGGYLPGGQLVLSSTTTTGAVRCARTLNRYNIYSGSGGASGAVLEKEINVLPNDTFTITVGKGGAAGVYGTNVNNGTGTSRSGNGNRGGTTTVVHKRGGVELGTYIVKGGFGGFAAKTDTHGEVIASNKVTPSDMCSAKTRSKTTDSFTTSQGCSAPSYSGDAGSSNSGGNGGRVKNTGTITQSQISSGGYMYKDSARGAFERATAKEGNCARGQDAQTTRKYCYDETIATTQAERDERSGFGGGGGFGPSWASMSDHFFRGGKGANGKVEITYKVSLPGGGGGSSARVAGSDNNNKPYEIIYKVKEGDRIVFKVGSGGSGGLENQDGLNGTATIVGDNDIVFLAGEGGKTATESDKNNLKGGRGGYTSYINEEDNIQSNIQTGIKLKSKTPPITYTINPPNNSFKGQNGTRGGVPEADTIQSGYTITNTIFSYGFNGGMGASPFNVEKSKTAASISCGGGIQGTLGQTTNLKYLCTSGNTKGNDARNHDPVNNEFGGSGGGGGGVKDDSFEQGQGGNGSSGYLRIRWDASEQE